jgi:hypothetical protein
LIDGEAEGCVRADKWRQYWDGRCGARGGRRLHDPVRVIKHRG